MCPYAQHTLPQRSRSHPARQLIPGAEWLYRLLPHSRNAILLLATLHQTQQVTEAPTNPPANIFKLATDLRYSTYYRVNVHFFFFFFTTA